MKITSEKVTTFHQSILVLTATVIDQVNEEPNNRPLLRIYKVENDEVVKKAEYDRFRDISNPSLRDNQSFTVLADGYIMFQSKNYVELIDLGNDFHFLANKIILVRRILVKIERK